ncbi:MAG: hypothetical protein MRY83_13190 [Flavobacteriales bacterium]|nr:hypothetical protein [Flavobacteriales bacterium]
MKRKLLHFFAIIALLASPFIARSQQPMSSDEEVELEPENLNTDYKRSFILEMGRPFALANNEYFKNYKGLYYIKGSMNFLLFDHFLFGGYIGHHVLDNTKFDNIRNPNLKTEITKNANVTGGLQLGYEKKIRKKEILITHANIGYAGQSYKRKRTSDNSILESYEDQGINAGATFMYGVFIEDKGAVLGFLTYQLIGTTYDPDRLELSTEDNPSNQPTQQFSFGLVFNFGF